ncbi:MFS transporter [Puniceicoccales bacterium CK1056]|uniref:MFS transporter n=1 Tax=Oceanipulchritudo coccoides TaxID=2706888 RepID=A0A6B2LZW9_9BACT|nr:MFS transporter [Oceanipulchritudo coccoides]NDV61045.1 MFS transporter [Oceanipulchritudo coccoides]
MEPGVNPEEIARRTYFWDRFRGSGQGIVETCWRVFALLVAIRVFSADESLKQFIPAGLGIGFLLSPVGLSLANRLPLKISTIVALLWVGVAGGLAGMILSPSIIPFVIFVACAQIAASQGVAMQTHLYSVNYPANKRGSWLSTTFLLASFMGIGFGYVGGELLDWDVHYYPVIFGVGIIAALCSAFSAWRIPSESAHSLQTQNPIKSLAIAWHDRLFGMMLFAWMLMGLGNLMMIPIRVEYLANPLYGINASNTQISALLISTVLTFRLISTKIWGYLFDRINVVILRVSLNMVFGASIFFFFFTDRIWVMGIGCALLGTAFGGGGILWSLYVTKIAPPDKVATYMSVHSFMTGLRMAFAPLIGYSVMEFTHPAFAAWIALLLIGISTLIFLPLKPLIDAKAKTLDSPPEPRLNSSNPA